MSAETEAAILARLDELTAEIRAVRKSIEAVGKTAAVPMPMRSAPREDLSARKGPDNGLALLEKALAAATHPETTALLNQQIAIARASAS